MLKQSREIRQAWALLSWRSHLPFYLAVFFTFASIGLLADTLGSCPRTPAWLLVVVTWSGAVAVGIAWSVMSQRPWLLPVFVALLLTLARLVPGREELAPDELARRVSLDAAGAIVLVAVGYAFFAQFITRELVAALRVRTEVALAREIHHQVVPEVDVRVGRFHAVGRAQPATEVGGDLFDVVGTGGGVVAYLADVTGHGVPAGMLSGMTKAAARTRLLADAGPTELMGDLDAVLSPLMSSAVFITCAAVRLDAEGRCEVALAGHPPVLRYVARDGRVERLGEPGLPLGVAPWKWESRSVALEPGDVLGLVSDGLAEVFDRDDRELGLEGIESVLAASGSRPLPEACRDVFEAARAHGAQQDDQTLLLIRVLEPGASVAAEDYRAGEEKGLTSTTPVA